MLVLFNLAQQQKANWSRNWHHSDSPDYTVLGRLWKQWELWAGKVIEFLELNKLFCEGLGDMINADIGIWPKKPSESLENPSQTDRAICVIF